MKGFLSTALSLALLSLTPSLKAQSGAEIDEARRLLREASALIPKLPEDQRYSAGGSIARAQVLAGDVQSAFAIAQQFSKPYERSIVLSSIAWSLDHNGDTNGAQNLVATIEDPVVRSNGYFSLAAQHARSHDFDAALRFAAMIQKNPDNRIRALVIIAENQFKAGDRNGAETTLQSAKEFAVKDFVEKGSAAELLVKVSIAQAEIGNRDAAMMTLDGYRQIANDAKSEDTTRAAITQLAIGLAQIGEIALAQETATQLPQHELDEVFATIATVKARGGDIESAIRTALSIRDENYRLRTIRSIALEQSKAGDYSGSAETLKNLSTDDRVSEMASIALNAADGSKQAGADALRLSEAAAAEAGDDAPSRAFEELAVTHAVLHEFGMATDMVGRMKNPESRVWPLWNITEMMVEAGNLQGAMALTANETEPHPKCYALLGTATGLLHLVEEERKKASH